MKPMTEKQFVKNYGELCPFCGKANLRRESISYFGDGEATQEVHCYECDTDYVIYFKVAGYYQ